MQHNRYQMVSLGVPTDTLIDGGLDFGICYQLQCHAVEYLNSQEACKMCRAASCQHSNERYKCYNEKYLSQLCLPLGLALCLSSLLCLNSSLLRSCQLSLLLQLQARNKHTSATPPTM